MNTSINTPHLVKKTTKFNHTIRLYHSKYCNSWTISITPLLTSENTSRRVITPKMAAHIIANINTFS